LIRPERGCKMPAMRLVIANKNYSSWSLRAWLLMRQADIPFAEERLSFNAPDFADRVRRYSPVAKVPVLVDGELVVWDSLAIAEYLAEKYPERKLWPAAREPRARARSLCAEMHSGFPTLRAQLPMNCELDLPGKELAPALRREIDRVIEIWSECRARAEGAGPFLFGGFTIADAYFAPVTRRFLSYHVALPEVARRYSDAISALPAVQEWTRDALAEHDFVVEDEPYRKPPQAGAR
jgi:glutathione S-transferase